MPSTKPTCHSAHARYLLITLAYLGVAHFAVGLSFTFWLAFAVHNALFLFALPYIGIAALFVLSAIFAHRHSLRRAIVALAVAILVSTGAFIYDIANNRYQISGMTEGRGCEHHYLIWWWYDS